MTLSLPAFAKVNLDLRVLGVRADGYHDLKTVFQSLALADRLTVRRTRGRFALTCDAPAVPTDQRNLVWKAASLLWRTAGLGRGEPRDVSIHLEKRIPAEAGLGGGSADAAVTLVALNRVWGLGLDGATLSRLAARLGADVPFFLVGGTALGLGRGDDIYPLADLPRVHVVLVRPAFGVSTADAYRWFDTERRRSRRAVSAAAGRLAGWAASLQNDLEPTVARHHPVISRFASRSSTPGRWRRRCPGRGRRSSGCSSASRRPAARARPGAAGVAVVATRTLARAEYRRRGGYDRL